MAKKQGRKNLLLQWVLVVIGSVSLFCLLCAALSLVVGQPEPPVAEEQPPQPTATEAVRRTVTETIAPSATSAEPPLEPTAQTTQRQAAQVVEVIDGDTLKVLLDGQEATIRLIGIDTPESVHPQQPVECFGREASARARELAADQPVQLEIDPTQDSVDRYGRLLRYVYLPNDTLLNWELVYQGYGFEYTYEVPYVYQAEFRQAEQDARQQQRGLWAPDACNGERKPADAPAPEPPTAPPVVEEAPPAPLAGNCSPAYANVCIPPLPPDLNCPEIRQQYGCNIQVVSWPDPHDIDRDEDGIACECQ
ncbi:MAG: nuclease [Chloroflexaceae bacterium]|nr:nuclease [Chloroflexaceae bacterium]